jgi:hypothetical protein
MRDDPRLTFEIVARISDPHFDLSLDVDDTLDPKLALRFGSSPPQEDHPNGGMLHLHFTDPCKALDLANELFLYAMQFISLSAGDEDVRSYLTSQRQKQKISIEEDEI